MAMASSDLDPEIAAALARDLARYGPRAALAAENVAALRADFLRRRLERGLQGGPKMRAVRDIDAELPGRRVGLRMHVPEAAPPAGPALFYFHGGGWVWGSIDSHDRIMRELAQRSGQRVVGVAYRKAPEHPFPAPFEDCRDAVAWALAHAEALGIDMRRAAFGGDSAGAGLALAVGMEAAARGQAPPTLLLFYGSFDSDLETGSYRASFGDGRFGLSRADMAIFLDLHLGAARATSDPRAVPLRGSHAGLRRAFLLGCGLDPLRDDTRRLAASLAAAGVGFEFDEIATANHGFLALVEDVAIARAALAKAAAHLARAFAAGI
jgi:acetyl esterase